ncbi:MAG: preprotein translocase subunit SecY [Candidatus Peregrinibacteria bacterium]
MNFLLQIWNSKDLRQKIIFTIAVLVLYRLLAQITVPGIDPAKLREFFGGGSSGALGIYAMITGGAIQNFSIVLMGLAPYINASIIVQLMTVVIPKLETLSKEGDAGRKTINKYTRWLALPFAILQSYGMITIISNIPGAGQVIHPNIPAEIIPAMIIVSTGTLLLMWMGEMITEKGIGNGISLLIFASIVSNIPTVVGRIFSEGGVDITQNTKIASFIGFLILTAVLLFSTILMTEGHRKIPITYGSSGKSGVGSAIPIRALQSGMIPIIFALSIITFPAVITQVYPHANNVVTSFIKAYLSSSNPSFVYFLLYFFLIIFFSFFYVSVVFKPDQIAENIQKRGGFVPGYRPGRETAEHIGSVSARLNLWGGAFLGIVAILPTVFTLFTELTTQDLIISGSGIIIIVGVVLDFVRRVNAQLIMHDYEKLK